MFRKIFNKIIKIYQKTLSPDSGWFKDFFPNGVCRYYPTCSEYSRQAICEHGLIKGGAYSIKRVLKCNPLSKGGFDPIIKK